MREAWIDRWKGLLILLVVLGHVVGGGGNLAAGSASNLLLELRRVIYIFHMPSFFVLAGLCWKSSSRNSFSVDTGQFVVKRVRRLIIPYIVFGVFSWLVYDAIFGKWGDLGVQMLRLLIATDEFRCNSVLWFLPAMFIVLLVAFVVDRLFKPSIKILCAIAIVDYIVFFILRYNHVNELPFKIFPAIKYYFYFLVGVIMKRMFHEKCFKLSGVSIVVLLTLFVIVAFTFKYDTRLLGGFTLWMFLGIVGASLSAAVAQILPEGRFKWLEWIGGMSMGIMLVHKFPLVAVQEHIPCVRAMFGNEMLSSLFGVAIVFMVTVAVSIAATLLLRKVVPWSIGERKCKY